MSRSPQEDGTASDHFGPPRLNIPFVPERDTQSGSSSKQRHFCSRGDSAPGGRRLRSKTLPMGLCSGWQPAATASTSLPFLAARLIIEGLGTNPYTPYHLSAIIFLLHGVWMSINQRPPGMETGEEFGFFFYSCERFPGI